MDKNIFYSTLKYLFVGTLFLFFNQSFAQVDLAVWNFESFPANNFTNPATSIGTGLASVITGTGLPPSALGTASGNGNASGCGGTLAGNAWQITNFDPGTSNETNGVEFKTSTVGYENIIFKWDQRWSNSAPNTVRVKYTIDGTNWIDFNMNNSGTLSCLGAVNSNGTFLVATPGDTFRRFTIDFTSIIGAANNPNFGIRLLAAYNQATGDFRQATLDTATSTYLLANNSGTWRFDNVSFSGSLFAGPTLATLSTSNAAICGGDSVNLNVAITGGQGPFNLIYSVGTTQFTVPNYVSGTNIALTPTATTTYSIVSVRNAPAVIGNSNFSASNTGTPTINVNTATSITTAAATSGNSCYSTFSQTATLAYSGTTGTPNRYSITWNAVPTNSFAPVAISTNLLATPINITIPANTPAGTYTGNIIVRNSSTNCYSVSKTFTLTVNPLPSIVTHPSTAPQTVCQGDNFSTLTVAAGAGPGISYQWYRNTLNSTIGGTALTNLLTHSQEIANGSKTASFIPLSNNTAQPYYFYCRVSGTCTPSVNSTVSGLFTVLPKTTIRTVSSPQTICAGSIVNDLALSAGSETIVRWEKSTDITFVTGVFPIANATPTLTGATIGSLSQTTYFRVFVNNGTCDIPTNSVAISLSTTSNYYNATGWDVAPTASSTAIIWDSANISTNFNCCSLVVKAGANVTIGSGIVVTIQNQLINSGTLTFENNASLVQPNNVTNPANVTTGGNTATIVYKRNSTLMNPFDYTYWSSPVNNQNLYDFSPNTRFDKYFYWKNTVSPSYYYWSEITNGAAPMVPGNGYIIRAPLTFGNPAAIFNGVFTGIPNNGDITVPVIANGLNNCNLVGNPYPSALNADDFFNYNGTTIYKTLYLWTHNTPINLGVSVGQYTTSDFAIYNLAGGVGTQKANSSGVTNAIPSGKIAAGQAFFIEAINSGNIIFRNDMRDATAGNNAQFFRNSNNSISNKNRLWLELSNAGGAFSQTLFSYYDGATNYKDNGYDANVFDESPTISLYSMLNNEKMAIKSNALPFQDIDTNALGFTSKIASTYELKLAQMDGLFDNQDVFLEDKLLNVIHDLKQSSYNFATAIGTFNERFVLRFTNTSLTNDVKNFNENDIQVSKQNNGILVQSSSNAIQSVSIYDTNGRLLLETRNINANNFKTENLQISNQIILVKTTTTDNLVVTKKIIF